MSDACDVAAPPDEDDVVHEKKHVRFLKTCKNCGKSFASESALWAHCTDASFSH